MSLVLAGLDERAGAARTNMHSLTFTLVLHQLFLDIGLPLTICSLFRVTYIVTKLRSLTADLTFRHCCTSRSLLVTATGAMIPQIGETGNR
jgi:hypothetical protein